MTPDPNWLTLKDAAKRLGLCQRLLRRYVHDEHMRVDEFARIHADDIMALEKRWERERAEAHARSSPPKKL